MSNQRTRLHRLLNTPAILRPEYLGYASIEIVHPDNTVTVVKGTSLQQSVSTSQMLAEHPLFGSKQHSEPGR